MTSGYPSDWDSRRKKVYKRDDYTCQHCGARGGPSGNVELHAHHIVPKSNGGRHHLSNLVTICSDCHRAIHGDFIAPSPGRQPTGLPQGVKKINNEILQYQANTLEDLHDFTQLVVKVISGQREPDSSAYVEYRRSIRLGNDRIDGILTDAREMNTDEMSLDISRKFEEVVKLADCQAQDIADCVRRAESCFNYVGTCHSCFEDVDPDEASCSNCGTEFVDFDVTYTDNGDIDYDPLVNDLTEYMNGIADRAHDLTAEVKRMRKIA